MMKKSILATLITLSAGFASTAMAALPPVTVNGGTVNFQGNLIPAACEVSVDSKDMAIDLGTVELASLPATSGFRGNPVPFSIKLINCDSSISSLVAVRFDGISTGGTFTNTATDSPTNLNLGFKDSDGNGMGSGNGIGGYTPTKAIQNGEVILSYSAQYHRPDTTPTTPGNSLYPVTFKVKYS